MRGASLYESAPVLMMTFGSDRTIVDCNDTAMRVLGVGKHRNLDEVADAASVRTLGERMVMQQLEAAATSCLLKLYRRDGEAIAVEALVDKISCDGSSLLRVIALEPVQRRPWLDELTQSEALLRSFVRISSEATWCIEFTEAVDLTLGDHEIVRQVFENECRWRLCNESMARIYGLPPGLDFNKQPVSLYFPRNSENEAFIRQIIESNFAVDSVFSIDTRHDGTPLYVENTVRSDIQGGRLLRLWGTVRDITGYRQKHNRLLENARDVGSILGAVPDAILVIDRNRQLLAVNPSFETLLGWNPAQFLGRDIQPIVDLETVLPGGRRWYGVDRQRWITDVRKRGGAPLLCDVQSAPIGDEAPDRFVLSLRPVLTAQAQRDGDAS